MTLEVIDYKSLAESRYTNIIEAQEPVKRLIETIVEYKQRYQEFLIELSNGMFDVDNSVGHSLDLVGKFIGQDRILYNFDSKPYFGFAGAPNAQAFNEGVWYSLSNIDPSGFISLNDDLYRRLVKARIIKNNTNCSRDDLLEVINLLTGNTNNTLIEESQGKLKVEVMADNEGFFSYYFSKRGTDINILPLPIGCRLSVDYL